MYHTGNGVYKGDYIPVLQFCPYQWRAKDSGNGYNGQHWFANSNRGVGSFILFSSTMHGSFGHETVYPWDEYVCRMGVSGKHGITTYRDNYIGENNINCHDYAKQDNYEIKGTVAHYSRAHTDSYIYLPTGYYDFTYDINTEVLSFTRKGRFCRVGEYSGDKTKTYEYYEAPYDDVPYPGLTASAYGNTFKTTGGFVLYAETDNWAWYRSWNNHAQENNY